jgi:hypothetical protein
MPAEKLEHVRRVLSEPGEQVCAFCQERQGVVSSHPNPRAPRLCYSCAMRLYQGAVTAGQQELG